MPGNISNDQTNTTNFAHGLAIDTLAAGAAAAVTVPFETTKKRLQTLKPNQKLWLGFNIEMLRQTYLGGKAFMGSVGLTTAAQGFTARAFQRANDGAELSAYQLFFAAAIGGFFSPFSENVILRQQNLERQNLPCGSTHAVRSLCQQSFFRPWLGLIALITRESIFGTCYMSADKVNENHGFMAVLLLGAAGSLASHPFDRIATEQQNYEIRHFWEAARKIYNEGGVRNLYKGGACRIGLFTGCMITLAGVKGALRNTAPATTTTTNGMFHTLVETSPATQHWKQPVHSADWAGTVADHTYGLRSR